MINIRDIFNQVEFESSNHSYTVKKDNSKLTSCTQKIGQFKPAFDPEGFIIRAVAKKNNMTVEEVQDMWSAKSKFSLYKGTLIHNTIEDLINSKFNYKQNSQEELVFIQKAMYTYTHFISFLSGKLYPELLVYDLKLGIAGQIDLVEQLEDGSLNIYDWKTNNSIDTQSKYNNKMLDVLNHLDDCNYNHYKLQLTIYKKVLERAGFKVNKLVVVHIADDDIYCYNINPNELNTEVESMLNIKRKDIITDTPIVLKDYFKDNDKEDTNFYPIVK